MNEETINQIKEVMAPVAQKIGQGAEYGWEIVLKQQYVEAVLGSLTALLGIFIICVSIYFGVKWWNNKRNYCGEYNNENSICTIILGSVVGGAFLLPGLTIAITHFINPEFYAIEFFINLVK